MTVSHSGGLTPQRTREWLANTRVAIAIAPLQLKVLANGLFLLKFCPSPSGCDSRAFRAQRTLCGLQSAERNRTRTLSSSANVRVRLLASDPKRGAAGAARRHEPRAHIAHLICRFCTRSTARAGNMARVTDSESEKRREARTN